MTDTPSELSDQHYYLAGYSAEDDPYVQDNGVLTNLGGFTDTESLSAFENDLAMARMLELQETPILGDFNLSHLCAIHHWIFQDVYPWAGQIRKVDIGKNDTRFLTHTAIPESFDQVQERILKTDCFASLHGDLAAFSAEAGAILGQINIIHAFREGNGRTQRELLQLLALRAGFSLRWGGVSDMAMKQACIAAESDPDCKDLTRIIRISAYTL